MELGHNVTRHMLNLLGIPTDVNKVRIVATIDQPVEWEVVQMDGVTPMESSVNPPDVEESSMFVDDEADSGGFSDEP